MSQIISLEVLFKARYSASAEEQETVSCFLERQEIKESPRNIERPVVDRLLSQQVDQSASTNPFKDKSGDAE